MSIIGRHMNRTMNIPDDGDDNPKARRRGFSAFVSLARTPDPDADPTWEARTIPMDPPPVPVVLPFESDAWTDPDHEDESGAETVDIRAELRVMQHDLYSLDIG